MFKGLSLPKRRLLGPHGYTEQQIVSWYVEKQCATRIFILFYYKWFVIYHLWGNVDRRRRSTLPWKMAISNASPPVPRNDVFVVCWGGSGLSNEPLINLIGLLTINTAIREHEATIAFWPPSSPLTLCVVWLFVCCIVLTLLTLVLCLYRIVLKVQQVHT